VARTLTKADRALAATDPVMAGLVERLGPMSVAERRRRRGQSPDDAYGTLLRAIIGQQLSTKAARTIYERVVALFDTGVPSPQQLLDADQVELRGAGLSGRKVEYLRDLAAHVVSGDLSDEEVIEEVTAIRGLGRWTAEMFLMFHLGRPDVVSGGDLGIRRAIQVAYGLDEMPTPIEVAARAEAWRPNRTLACIYLWESLSAAPVE
jgi:DNA-3-methyladenine glycosylase II